MEDKMSTTKNIHAYSAMLVALQLLITCGALLLTGVARGQVQQSHSAREASGADRADTPEAIAKVKAGEFSLLNVEQIAAAHAVQAIPVLEKQFVLSRDSDEKGKIASALVRLGDKDGSYWDYLVKEAAPAEAIDAPPMVQSDGQPGPSPEFAAWAKVHNVTTDTALETMYRLSIKVLFLASTGDPRGIPPLRRDLFSPDPIIQEVAARGLAEAQDKGSIPLIIEACKKTPVAALAIAQSLVYFDNPQAQAAVDTYIPKERAKTLRDARANGKTPFH